MLDCLNNKVLSTKTNVFVDRLILHGINDLTPIESILSKYGFARIQPSTYKAKITYIEIVQAENGEYFIDVYIRTNLGMIISTEKSNGNIFLSIGLRRFIRFFKTEIIKKYDSLLINETYILKSSTKPIIEMIVYYFPIVFFLSIVLFFLFFFKSR